MAETIVNHQDIHELITEIHTRRAANKNGERLPNREKGEQQPKCETVELSSIYSTEVAVPFETIHVFGKAHADPEQTLVNHPLGTNIAEGTFFKPGRSEKLDKYKNISSIALVFKASKPVERGADKITMENMICNPGTNNIVVVGYYNGEVVSTRVLMGDSGINEENNRRTAAKQDLLTQNEEIQLRTGKIEIGNTSTRLIFNNGEGAPTAFITFNRASIRQDGVHFALRHANPERNTYGEPESLYDRNKPKA